LYNLSFTYAFTIQPDEARRLTEEAILMFQAADDPAGVARARWSLSNIEYSSGHPRESRQYALQALETFEAMGDAFMTGWAVYTIALADSVERNVAAAEQGMRRALSIFDQAGDVSGYTL